MKLTKKILTVFLFLVMILGLGLSVNVSAEDDSGLDTSELTTYSMVSNYTTDSAGTKVVKLTTDASNMYYNVSEGYVLTILGGNNEDGTITFTNCTFYLTGATVQTNLKGITGVGDNGESRARLAVAGYVTFKNCTFLATNGNCIIVTKDDGSKGYSGWDSAISLWNYSASSSYVHSTITFESSKITGTNWKGQFIGTFAYADVVFNNSTVETTGNTGGWSYAMYGCSTWTMNSSNLTATGELRDSDLGNSNINCFYTGDSNTYLAVTLNDSYVNFYDNQAGGIVLNYATININNSKIYINNNLGNASNSGYWIVKDSTIEMNGNRGGHAMSCINFEMTNSELEILHNGYAGVYITKDSSLKKCTVDIRCNGEKLLSYSAGDVWLNGHTLSVDDCTSNALEGSAWLGAVGRKGSVTTTEGSSVVAYDLSSNSADNLKSNCTAVLTSATVALSSEEDEHTLFLNPWMTTSYARGNGENKKVHTSQSSNDVDLFEDDNVDTDGANYIINAKTAKIGILTTAQLSHHIYDWDNEIFVSAANEDDYGVVKYECIDVCGDYTSNTDEHTYSFDCEGTYVYAPLVGLTFDANTEDEVTNMPDTQDEIDYDSTASEPTSDPEREGYRFEGWYVDEECTEEYDFDTQLTSNWTVVYAKWVECTEVTVTKEWSGETDDSVRPDFITVELYADGEATGNTIEIIEDEDGNWVGEFTKLDITNSDGKAIVYTVVESSVDNYEATYSDVLVDDNGYYSVTITNTYVETLSENTEDPEEPKTSEEVEAEADLEQEPVEETSETCEAETESDTSDQSLLIGYGVVGIITLLGVYLTIKSKKEN